MRGKGSGRGAAESPDAVLWRRSRMVDAVEDDAERFLDLAGFADGRLDEDDRERVAEWLARSPEAAGDVAIARAVSVAPPAEEAPAAVLARAAALVEGDRQTDNVVTFPLSRRQHPRVYNIARWSSLAAAMAVASWLGFTLGMDTSLSFAQIRQAGEVGFLREMLDPSPGFMRDLTEGAQT